MNGLVCNAKSIHSSPLNVEIDVLFSPATLFRTHMGGAESRLRSFCAFLPPRRMTENALLTVFSENIPDRRE